MIKCPFYLTEKKNYIYCEGFLKGTSMITAFSDAAAKREHIRGFCFLADGGSCPMAVNLYEKYKSSDRAQEELLRRRGIMRLQELKEKQERQ